MHACGSAAGLTLLLAASLHINTSAVHAKTTSNELDLSKPLRCDPVPSYFCANIHIGCAGKTTIKTWSFTVQDYNGRTEANPLPDQTIPEHLITTGNYKVNESYLLLNFQHSKNYVKILSTGKFSYRLYYGNKVAMTYGWCQNQAD